MKKSIEAKINYFRNLGYQDNQIPFDIISKVNNLKNL